MPIMRLRAEKKMRKHLIEQMKARKVLGSRLAQGYKTQEELARLNLAPQVYMFKNLFSGQVLYSQVPGYHQDQIDTQFLRPNWENRKPSRRNDLWRIMCVVNFANYDYAVAAYDGLLQLREARDIHLKTEAKAMRKKNDEGNTWYSGQYRPTHAQEAIADLAQVIDEFELENTTAFWESLWRKGADEHWRNDLVMHESLPVFNPKYQSVLLEEMKDMALAEFARLREAEAEASAEEREGEVVA
ncbi:CIC11C00000000840 [Sungouiella intermedia]|uniref:Large ribosomal subunit protein mL67 n=1 Tax=Sungouiella intermedia TaxID=45354 RepID=A0A1L0G6H8_9ASCO|nr:CIC11C00000000840 [[Candida] intermedia]SGZ52141.1 CIC11C00000002331 [[Candida] intermedia]